MIFLDAHCEVSKLSANDINNKDISLIRIIINIRVVSIIRFVRELIINMTLILGWI